MKLKWACVLSFFMSLLWVPSLMSQTAGTGALTGTVTDPSGAVVPNATVTATSIATGQARTTMTGTDGTYKFSLLPPGMYRVRIEAGGFRPMEIPSATITVTETAVLDRALEVGSQTQAVTVEGEVETVQTTSSAMGSVVTAQTVTALPLSTRNYTNLLAMSAGANADVTNASTLGKASTAIASNGGDITQNTYLQDGVSVNNWLSVNTTQEGTRYGAFGIPNPDTIQEFKIQTSTYDAGYGRDPGANVNIITKSGTNDFHGSAFEFFRNTALNANDFFRNATVGSPGNDGSKQVLNQNQYGGVFGGPIKKDKLFFFVSYQETDQKNGIAGAGYSVVTLPPIPSGNRGTCPTGWTALSQCDGAAQAFVPALGAAVCPANNPTNSFDKIKTSGSITVACNGSNINSVAINILQLQLPGGGYLIPGSGSTTGQYLPASFSDPATYKDHQGMGNWDYVLNNKNTLSGRYYYEADPTTSPFAAPGTSTTASKILPGAATLAKKINHAAVLRLTTILSNNLVNEARFSYQRVNGIGSELTPFTNSQVGITNISPAFNYLDNFNISGLFSFGAQKYADQLSTVNQFQWADQVSWSHGKHTIRTGFEAERVRSDLSTTGLASGNPSIRSFPDFLIGRAGCQAFTGAGVCSASNPGNTNGSSASNINSPGGASANPSYNDLFRVTVLSGFVQDDLKLTSRVTLNLGVRWEWDGFPIEANGNASGFWPSLANVVPGSGCLTPTGQQIGTAGGTGCSLAGFVVPHNFQGMVPTGVFQNATNYTTQTNPPWHDFAPRVGFAWQPTASNRLVVRGGAGYFYELLSGQVLGIGGLINAPAFGTITASPLASLAQPFIIPASIPGPPGTFGFTPRWVNLANAQNSNLSTPSIAQNFTVPVTYEWNLNTQYEFLRNWVLELGYVGSHGIHQNQTISAFFLGQSYNWAALASASNPINGQTTNTVANVPERVPYLGISPTASQSGNQASYIYNALQATVRKQLSHGLQLQAAYTWNRAFASDPYGINTAPYIIRQMAPNLIYHPQRLVVNYTWNLPLGHPAGFVGKIVDGWSISGVTTIQDGTPFTVYDSSGGSVFFGTTVTGAANFCPGMTISNATTSGPIASRLGGAFSQNGYFNTAGVFCPVPALGADGATGFGNNGQGNILGPGQSNWDMSLAKSTKVGGLRENATLLFRAEFFNAFNHPQFAFSPANDAALANQDASSAAAGQITTSAVNPRLIQFVLKYSF
jgi:hypothetical protein